MINLRRVVLTMAVVCCGVLTASAADDNPEPKGQDQERVEDVLREQAKPRVHPRVLEKAGDGKVSIHISLDKQRAFLRVGEEVAIDTPISSGKQAGMTPRGEFEVLEKTERHRSSLYGNFVDDEGRVVRSGVSANIDSGPSGTVFQGEPMRYFLRLNWEGAGIHAGHLPGYPASHGSVRLPEDIARLFYEHVEPGTVVVVGD